MRLPFIASACALGLVTAACGQKAEEPPVAQQPDANPAMTVGTPTDEASAEGFVTKAAVSDMYEIEAAKAALAKSSNGEVKAFAQMMIDGHTKSTNDLKATLTAGALPLTPPPALPEDKAKEIADLNAKSAADFDKAYLDDQVNAHQATLDTVQRYANDGDNAQLKAFAAGLAPVVQQHLDRAKALRDGLK